MVNSSDSFSKLFLTLDPTFHKLIARKVKPSTSVITSLTTHPLLSQHWNKNCIKLIENLFYEKNELNILSSDYSTGPLEFQSKEICYAKHFYFLDNLRQEGCDILLRKLKKNKIRNSTLIFEAGISCSTESLLELFEEINPTGIVAKRENHQLNCMFSADSICPKVCVIVPNLTISGQNFLSLKSKVVMLDGSSITDENLREFLQKFREEDDNTFDLYSIKFARKQIWTSARVWNILENQAEGFLLPCLNDKQKILNMTQFNSYIGFQKIFVVKKRNMSSILYIAFNDFKLTLSTILELDEYQIFSKYSYNSEFSKQIVHLV